MALSAPSKQALRDEAFARRGTIPPEMREKAGLALRDNFLENIYLPKGSSISAYMPIGSEISPLPLLEVLLTRGHTVLMPRVVPNNPLLEFRAWNTETPMIASLYGIPEPDPAHAALSIPDLFLLPLLAFDARGSRLGYGAGYYDQTLAQLKGKVPFKVVGVAYELQRYDALPAEPHDYPLDMCLTESRAYTFKEKAA